MNARTPDTDRAQAACRLVHQTRRSADIRIALGDVGDEAADVVRLEGARRDGTGAEHVEHAYSLRAGDLLDLVAKDEVALARCAVHEDEIVRTPGHLLDQSPERRDADTTGDEDHPASRPPARP